MYAVKREVITSRQNALMVHVKKLLSSRSYREKSGEFAADGTKLLQEAAKWYDGLHTVIVQTSVELCELPQAVRVVEVPESLMRAISPMETPQGALFICRLPEQTQAEIEGGCIILDGIQDPGNLGTMLRTADALGVGVVLTEGCADVYSHKTVRASMGAVFRTQPQRMMRADVVRMCKEKGITLLATAMSDDAKVIRDVDLSNTAVIIGSEGQGVSEEFMTHADGKIIIPMNEKCESLNAAVAAAIVMWQIKR